MTVAVAALLVLGLLLSRTPAQLALESRVGLSIVVVGLLLAALLIHRLRRAVLFLVLLGLVQLSLGAAYGLSLWLAYRPLSGVIK